MKTEKSKALFEKARGLMPGGVNSPVRAFGAVGGHPLFIAHAEGATITDVDGNSFIDYVCSWGPLILGHCHPAVVQAICEAGRRGTSYGAPHEAEITLAERVKQAMPWVERIRFVNSGTEATMSALRLARAATGRNRIVKFDGNYHGHVDALLAKAGSGVATFGLPDTAGVPAETTRETVICPYNDAAAVRGLFDEVGTTIAAIIVEAVAGNVGVIPPELGFLKSLRDVTRRNGALLIFDEVISGFRVAKGGAAERYNVQPDLVCLGKIIGGGLPVGAYGGQRDLMEMVAPLGHVYQAGTLSGNPLAMAAGAATLDQLTPEVYSRLEKHGNLLQEGLQDTLQKMGLKGHINRVASMLSVFFTEEPVKDAATALKTNRNLYARCFHALLGRGVYLPPSALEAWFVSTAHTEAQLDYTISAFRSVLKEALAAKDHAGK